MTSAKGYWADLNIEAETQTPLLPNLSDVCCRFPDVLVTLPPKGWYRTKPRVDNGWGCGYRNAQTIFSALLDVPEFAQRLPKFVPSISSIQLLIETAWQNGFDSLGAGQLGWELVGTKKWIGATELATLFAFLGIKCEVIDLTASTGKTPTGRPVHKALVEWVNSHLTSCIAFPIYLQFSGHSQTIVGCRSPDKGIFILDPSIREADGRSVDPKFVPTPATNKPQYQMIAVTGIVDGSSREALKRTFNHKRLS